MRKERWAPSQTANVTTVKTRGPAPFYLVDQNAWDFEEYGPEKPIIFNVNLEAAVQDVWDEIVRRGCDMWVVFYHKRLFSARISTVVSLFEGGNSNYHVEVWFGNRVAVLAVSEKVALMPWYFRRHSHKEIVRLPYKNKELAFRIAVDIVRRAQNTHYSEHYLEMLGKVLRVPPGRDYDEERPETWTSGAHCSQLTLLFLKRCVRHGALPLEGDARRRLLGTYSHTCLPCELRVLMQSLWGDELKTKVIEPDSAEESLEFEALWDTRKPTVWLEPASEEERGI
jgi:hypothetical protein